MNKLIAAIALTAVSAPIWAAATTVSLSIPTMDCPVCPITVKKALTRVAGVSQAEVNFGKRVATVTFDDTRASIEALKQATRKAGYPSTLEAAAK